MITGAALLARGAWKAAGKAVGGVGNWLGGDHNWWKICCFGLGMACMFASFLVYDARKTITVIELEAVNERSKHVLVVTGLNRAIIDRDRALKDVRRALDAEAAKLAAIRKQNEGLEDEMERRVKAAGKSAAAFDREYKNRPETCQAALRVLAQACPALQSY